MTAAPDMIKVLDKGFIRLVDSMGGDSAVVESARVSYGSGTKGAEKDRKLLNYLLRHDHMTPFEQAVFKFHVSAPLFVMRQWIRHRMSSYNEISARYTEVKDEFYSPEIWRAPDPKNKQASQASPQIDQKHCRETLEKATQSAFAAYHELIKAGAARELARMVLPVNLYTQFYWTVNARSLMHFITLRADANAQWEIQKYAEALAGVFAERMPWTWEAYLSFSWKGSNPILDDNKRRLTAEAPTAR